jgi:preprotein translocase subunit SecG
MGVLASVITVLFVILCVLLILAILLQSDKGAGMGILGGSSQSAFGSSTADVITKITAVMVGLFLLGALSLSALESYKSSSLEKKLNSSEATSSGELKEDKLDGLKDKDKKTEPKKDNK